MNDDGHNLNTFERYMSGGQSYRKAEKQKYVAHRTKLATRDPRVIATRCVATNIKESQYKKCTDSGLILRKFI